MSRAWALVPRCPCPGCGAQRAGCPGSPVPRPRLSLARSPGGLGEEGAALPRCSPGGWGGRPGRAPARRRVRSMARRAAGAACAALGWRCLFGLHVAVSGWRPRRAAAPPGRARPQVRAGGGHPGGLGLPPGQARAPPRSCQWPWPCRRGGGRLVPCCPGGVVRGGHPHCSPSAAGVTRVPSPQAAAPRAGWRSRSPRRSWRTRSCRRPCEPSPPTTTSRCPRRCGGSGRRGPRRVRSAPGPRARPGPGAAGAHRSRRAVPSCQSGREAAAVLPAFNGRGGELSITLQMI